MTGLYLFDLQRLINVAPSDFSRVSREIAKTHKVDVARVRRDAFGLTTQAPQLPA